MMRRITTAHRWFLVALAALLTAWAPVELAAQQGRQRPPRTQMERQLRERFQEMMAQRLQLTEEQRFALREITSEMEDTRRELAVREARVQAELRTLGGDIEEARAQELLAEIVAIMQEEAELAQLEIRRLEEVLQARQVVAFILFREDLGRRIREIRDRARRGGGGGDGTSMPRRPFMDGGLDRVPGSPPGG